MLLFESFNEIHEICQKYGLENYTINPDGSLDVDGDVDFNWSKLEILPLKFRNVTGDFDCEGNKLTTLKGAPKSVGGSFYCGWNELTTLEGCPQSVGGSFYCSWNELTTLEGCPQSVSGNFDCSYNKLTTLENAPKSVGEGFACYNNALEPIRVLFPDDTTFYKLCKEWEFFAGGSEIHRHKFLEAMLDIGKKVVPRTILGYKYI